MAAADPVFESLQRLQSMMESFDESLSKLCKNSSSESAVDLRKNMNVYYHGLLKALKSWYKTFTNEKKPEYEGLKIKEKKPEEPGTRDENKENKTSKATVSSSASLSSTKVLSSVEVRPEIKTLCDKADGRGLITYIADHREEAGTLRNELPVALSKAPDAAKLVLKALEGYDFSNSGSNFREGMELLHSPSRRACVLLLESLFPVFGNDESGVVPLDVKDSAREIAKVWRKEMKIEKNAESVSPLDVQAFLQLLVTFRIAADYEKDDILELVLAIARHKQTLELCRSLGLSSKVPDLMDTLSKRGLHLTALKFARAFGMMDKVDPVDLLTSYLKDAEKGAKEFLKNEHSWAGAQNAAYRKELDAVRTAINFVKEYNLKCPSFEDDLQNKLRVLLQRNKEMKKNRKKDAKKQTQEKEDGRKADEKGTQRKRCQSSELGNGPSESEDYVSKRAKHASPNETTRVSGGVGNSKDSPDNIDGVQKKSGVVGSKKTTSVAGGMGNSKGSSYNIDGVQKKSGIVGSKKTTGVAGGMGNSRGSPYNIDGVQKKSGIVGHDHHTSALSAANRSSTGLAVGAFTSAPSIASQINDEIRRHPSAFGTSNLTPTGSSLYGSSVPAGAFTAPLPNVADVNYEGRVQQKYTVNFGEVDKNHIRTSVYGTGDLAKLSANQSNHDHEGRGLQSYKLNLGEVSASAYGTGILANSSGTRSHYERRGPELFTSAFGAGNTGSIGSSVSGLNSRAILSSDVNQGQQSYATNFGEVYNNPVSASAYGTGILANASGTRSHYERRGPEMYTSAFGGGNTGNIGSSVYGSNSHTMPSSVVNQGGHERSLGQYSGFAGRNMVPVESSGYGPGVFPQYHLPRPL